MLEPGQLFENKYVIRELLGAGGFALVYRAHQPGVDRDVAIKVLRPAETLGTHPKTLLARFRREAKMAAELRNEHNIRLLDFGRSEDHDFLYMIFEFVDGIPLDELIRATGALSPRRVVDILSQLLEALGEAHKLGILHRDVKPQNIIIFDRLGQQDRAKLIDYGIAKPMGAAAEKGITTEGHVVGTPRYMAPEQILMLGELTPATDIYSLGLVAFEMLAGRALLGESTHTEVIKRQLSGEVFRLPPTLAAPPGLRAVIDRMLAKSARDRFQSAQEALELIATVDVEAPAETVPSVDALLNDLSSGEHRPLTSSDELAPTMDSRPPGSPPIPLAPDSPTVDADPSALEHALALDSREQRGVPPRKIRWMLVAIILCIAAAFVAVAVTAALVLSRSRAVGELGDAVVRKVETAATDCDDDFMEPNDRSHTGTPLETGSKSGVLCPGNVDWFKLGYHSAGDEVAVAVEYEEGSDDIDIEMFVDAQFVGGVYTPERLEVARHEIPRAGVVTARLYFPKVDSSAGRSYTITRDVPPAEAPRGDDADMDDD